MTRLIGWIMLLGISLGWAIMTFTSTEPPLTGVIGTASLLIAGAILAK